MKYTESPDLFDSNVLNLFDYETGVCIGYITQIKNSFIAVVSGKMGSATFNNISCAKGFISSAFYGPEPKKKSKNKQLSLLL